MNFVFYLTSILLGVGLAMDACAVSMSNGLKMANESKGSKVNFKKILFASLMFGLFQGLMPLIGYLIGAQFISYIDKFIPWIALGILGFLGGRMIIGAIKCETKEECDFKPLTFKIIIIQTVATSIDALSVGLTICDYTLIEAIVTTVIVALVTFGICIGGHYIGKVFGDKLGEKAELIGGIILVLIGLEIFISGMWF